MKRILTLGLPFVLAWALTAMAQETNPNSTTLVATPSTSNSASPSTASQRANNGQQTSVEGCIVRERTDYFLQPENGAPIKLNSTEDLSQHVGHHVRVQGTEANHGAGTATSAGATGTENPSPSSNPSGSGSPATSANPGSSSSAAGNQSGANREIQVTKVQMISETCPANIQNRINQSGGQGTSNPSTPPQK